VRPPTAGERTGKASYIPSCFDVLFSTTARWRDGKIVEEYLFYDSGAFMKQIGLAWLQSLRTVLPTNRSNFLGEQAELI
jgi:hypothetical protein